MRTSCPRITSYNVCYTKLLRIPGATSENRFELIFDGTEAYETLLAQIEAARESIWISTYVFGNDAVTAVLADALCAKRREGVEVKLLIDAMA